jgi:hypothetical protein
VVHSLLAAAHGDLSSYAGLMGITEGDESDRAGIEAVFRATVRSGVLEEEAWRPYFEHNLGDALGDHRGVSLELMALEASLGGERRRALLRSALLHTSAVVRMEHEILDYYREPDGPAFHTLDL